MAAAAAAAAGAAAAAAAISPTVPDFESVFLVDATRTARLCSFLSPADVADGLAGVSQAGLRAAACVVLAWRSDCQRRAASCAPLPPPPPPPLQLPPCVRGRIAAIKRALDADSRPETWRQYDFAAAHDAVLRDHRHRVARLLRAGQAARIPVVHVRDLPPARFAREFLGRKPVVIAGLADRMLRPPAAQSDRCAAAATAGAAGSDDWSFAALYRRCCGLHWATGGNARPRGRRDRAITTTTTAAADSTTTTTTAGGAGHGVAGGGPGSGVTGAAPASVDDLVTSSSSSSSSPPPSLSSLSVAAVPALRVGESDAGADVGISLADYLLYTAADVQGDDTPLYVFEENVQGLTRAGLLPRYDVPKSYFPDDLLHLAGDDDHRPPYKWWLLGARGTGTEVHVDPAGTDAWNAVLSGRKEWALVEPSATPDAVRIGTVANEEPASCWFRDALEAVAADTALPIDGGGTGDDGGNSANGAGRLLRARLQVVTQEAGSVIYVPSGWWHAAWNSADTLAVTQNFMTWGRFCRDARAFGAIVGGSRRSATNTATATTTTSTATRWAAASVVRHEKDGGGGGGGGCVDGNLCDDDDDNGGGGGSAGFELFVAQLYGLVDTATAAEWLRAVRTYAHERGLLGGGKDQDVEAVLASV